MADVERGFWQPSTAEPVETPSEAPTFHEFASEWLESRRAELRPRTFEDYEWALSYHLLPFFKDFRIDAIGIEDVDRYRIVKLQEGKLAANTLNKSLVRLAQILEVAVEYGHLDRNPAKGKRRRAKPTEPKRSWVEVEQVPYLLDAADRYMRPVVALLVGTGLRIGEACSLTWADLNLATGTLIVRQSKTTAGTGREVDLSAALCEELAGWKLRTPRKRPSDPVLVSRSRNGKHSRQTARNVQARLKVVVKAANERLAKDGIEPIPSVSPHSLRRTYASVRAALRDDPVYIAEQLGHRDARFTFRVYQKAAKRREKLSGRYLEAFDKARDWARMGTRADSGLVVPDGPDFAGLPESQTQSQIDAH